MPDISILGIVGLDGIVPVYDPTARWCIWSIDEIYDGTIGLNRYVPKVKDYVIDPDTYTTFVVKSIDAVTLIANLTLIRPANMTFSLSETDVLFGVGPGTQSDTYRAYLDTSVMPHVLAVDARLKIGGTMASYAKIFKGVDTTAEGVIISRMYDNSGNFLTHNVPLELIAIDSHVNYSIKNVGVCYTNLNLADGEIVTVVVFDAAGHVVSKRQLLVENTAFIRQINASHKYITSIALESPFMSATNSTIIEFPLNVPINALNLIGVVNYSDGSILRMPVDGTKFRIYGLDQYVSTIIGQKIDLVLSYMLSSGESVYGAVTSDNKYITEPYSVVTVDPNNAYTVKVYGYPVWIDGTNGYEMRWFMFNLDRNVFFDVTQYVRFAPNTGVFNPKGYGYLQRKAIQLNLRDISGAFKPYIHTQLVDIMLVGQPNGDSTPWTISNAGDSANTPYGSNLFVHRVTNNQFQTTIRVDSGLANMQAWIDRVYKETYPLLDKNFEINPPTPSHFVVTYGNVSNTFTIDQWNQNLVIAANIPIYGTVTIRFIKERVSSQLELSIAAMLVTT